MSEIKKIGGKEMKKRVFNLFMVFAVSVAICIPTNAAREYEENFREVKYMKFKRILSVALVCAVMIWSSTL